MDNTLQWRLQGTAADSSAFQSSMDRTPDDESAIEINYGPAGQDSSQFVELVRGKVIPVPDGVTAVSFWVRGNGSQDGLAIRLRSNEDGTTHEWRYPDKIDWEGWRKVSVSVAPDDPGLRSWRAGEKPMAGQPPQGALIFRSVVVQIRNPEATAKAVAIGSLHLENE